MAKARRGRKRDIAPSDRTGIARHREHWRSDGHPKTRFSQQTDANRTSLRLRLEEGADLDPYLCRYCGGWHLGNRRED